MTQLRELPLDSFVGGLNLRSNQFHLADNESPDMLNILVDPRGGFFTRKGWQRWQRAADFAVGDVWNPRSAEAHIHTLSADDKSVFVSNDGKVWHSRTGDAGVFSDLGIVCDASPHLADFGSWGDDVYIACGRSQVTNRFDGDGGTVTPMTPPSGADPGEGVNGPGGWQNDYTNPSGGYAPKAEFCEPHAGYMFYANLEEDLGGGPASYPTRIRWSHPGGQQESFAFGDYIDIDTGGGAITGLMSFQDHLLIFKRDSLWALYGYDDISWQLIKVSRHIGTPSSTAITRSENAVYFFSTSGRNGIYGYTDGSPVEISNNIRPAIEQIVTTDNVWLGWAGQMLICNLPWIPVLTDVEAPVVPAVIGRPSSTETSTFIFDLTVGQGAWTLHRMANGSLGPVVEGTDVVDSLPLSVLYQSVDGHQTVMELGARNRAADVLDTAETEEPFLAMYETRWLTAGHPDLRKSWRRPRHVVSQVSEPLAVRVDGFYDYEEVPRRAHILTVDTAGKPHWRGTMDSPPWDGVTPPDRPVEVPSADAGSASPAGDGFDWDDGTRWAAERAGALLIRTVDSAPQGGGFGKARALKLRYVAAGGVPWGINAIIMKFVARRFTT